MNDHATRSDRFTPGRRRALTLVEVLAVLVILGLLAGALAVNFSGAFGQAKSELAKVSIGTIVEKIEAYRISTGSFPANEQGLAVLTDGQAKPTDSYYLSPDQLVDPWGADYLYARPGPSEHPYEVLTYGADGQPGGDGENTDVSSTRLGRRGTGE